MRPRAFWISLAVVLGAGLVLTETVSNEYYFNALYLILQAMLMAIAWNVLGGFTGYVNFGAAGFFAVGAYTSVVLHKAFGVPLPLMIVSAGAVCGLIGLGVGYLTLRLKGVYFAIATLAMAIVIETLINNWSYVGGAKGYYMLTPDQHLWFDSYIQMLFIVMLLMTLAAIAVSRVLSSSRLGRGLAAIRDDEVAAECSGVPTLKLKLISATVMGVMMGVAGAPFPYFITFVDPLSAFSLFIAVNAIAMPLIGGTSHWIGPVIGAILVGTMQEVVKVTISSEVNVLVVGIMLVAFITLAPQGIVGVVRRHVRRRAR